MRHIGKQLSTNDDVFIVYRNIYDSKGSVVDDTHALVVKPDKIPDYSIKNDLANFLNDPDTQVSHELYSALHLSTFSGGENMLGWLHQNGHIIKVKTADIMVSPNASSSVKLNELNLIIKMQKDGKSQAEIALQVKNLKEQGDAVFTPPVDMSHEEKVLEVFAPPPFEKDTSVNSPLPTAARNEMKVLEAKVDVLSAKVEQLLNNAMLFSKQCAAEKALKAKAKQKAKSKSKSKRKV